MTTTQELIEQLMQAHNGHADEGASTFSEAAQRLRELEAQLSKVQAVKGTMDLDLARAMCRGAGISLVSRDFIERFADFVSDWKKGDFTLPKYAELDMQSCFDAWQAFDPDLAVDKAIAGEATNKHMKSGGLANE